MKRVGYGLLLLAFTSSTFASERYVEIWNPPEARTGPSIGARHDPSARKPAPAAKRKHVAPRVVEARMHHPPTAVKIAPKPRAIDDDLPRATPALPSPAAPDIPRQFTPDGNVLRVGTQGYGVEVSR